MEKNIQIKNNYRESLDTLVEGREGSDTTVIFVHGFGVDKNESFGYFTDTAAALRDIFRIVRFDFSGYGKSEGKQGDVNYQKQSEDLNSVIEYVKTNFPGKIFLVAHSMGSFVTSLLSPNGIERSVLSGVPNSNTSYVIGRLKRRIGSRAGAVVNIDGLTIYPRTSGEVQKIGPSFWRVLKEFKPVEAVGGFARKTKLLIIHFKQDGVLGTEHLSEYAGIQGAKILWLPGNHSVTRGEDRKAVIKAIREFFS